MHPLSPTIWLLLLLVLAACPHSTVSQISSNFTPPALPLVVKGPYLNAWLLRSVPDLKNWPTFWNAKTAVASFTAVIVDNTSYGLQGTFFGTPASMKAASELSSKYTPTSTSFTMQAGPMLVNATFLSPVTPHDLSQQSLPLSYYSLTFSATDGASHAVQIYSDFTSEWIASGDLNVVTNGSTIADQQLLCLEAQLVQPIPFSELDDFAQDSTGVYATSMSNTKGIQWQIGNFSDVRGLGINGTGLSNTIDPTFAAHAQFFPPGVLGMLADLGEVETTTSTPFVIAFGAFRNPSVQVTDLADEEKLRIPFYMANSSTNSIHDIASLRFYARVALHLLIFLIQTLSFLQNYTKAQAAAEEFDNKLINDTIAASESQQYADLVSLVVRGAMSSIEITLPQGNQGQQDLSDVDVFMKDMGGMQPGVGGSNGNVNPVDVLYATSPMYLYLNADILGYLLKPLLQAQQDSAYSGTLGFAAQNLGSQFPKAQLQVDNHKLGIEQSSNMLIMSLAHAQTSRDGTLISTYYTLLKQWAEYLVDNALTPNNQSSPLADGVMYSNQTNLALKGIIGIAAMGRISSLTNNDADSSRYEGISKDYISQWQTLSVSSDNTHLLLSYGQQSCAGQVYNLYADKLLQLNLVPDQIYDMQTAFHKGQLSELPVLITVYTSDWTMFTAAVMTDNLVRNGMISQIHQYTGNMFNSSTNAPFSTVYDPTTGNNSFGINRCVA
ncbi:DUF1793-domain-containing protein [Schizopora paradoxa]|uniref:DUF1793-domain-containing protein n=1 Tax=Schizopora paradoxa TaxID=27342 RepID=A0A0H2S3Y7_9AGAM|nr:DUF1793-domain-containing protein [Schizopora paradoxa]